MSILKLTKQQDEDIKQALGFSAARLEIDKKYETLGLHARKKSLGGGWATLKSLDSLSVEQMSIALFSGYEVLPEYKKGDYIKVRWAPGGKYDPDVYEVTEYKDGKVTIDWYGNPNPLLERTRLASAGEIEQHLEKKGYKTEFTCHYASGDKLTISKYHPDKVKLKIKADFDNGIYLTKDNVLELIKSLEKLIQ